jgi:hypothetical protein
MKGQKAGFSASFECERRTPPLGDDLQLLLQTLQQRLSSAAGCLGIKDRHLIQSAKLRQNVTEGFVHFSDSRYVTCPFIR